jgi:hypothetical protein
VLGFPAQFDSLITVTHNFLQGYQLNILDPFATQWRFDQPLFELHPET